MVKFSCGITATGIWAWAARSPARHWPMAMSKPCVLFIHDQTAALHFLIRGLAGDRGDAAHALRDRFLTRDLEVADEPGPRHVRAAAELHGQIGGHLRG